MSDGDGRDGAALRLANGPAEWFLAGVRAALADLPAAEVDDILGDVRAHLADLASELGSAFDQDAVVSRLGTPAEYAAELRTAAGYPPAPQAPERGRRGAARAAVFALLASTLTVVAGTLFLEPAMALFGAALVLVALPALVREGPRMPTVAGLPEVRWFLAAVPRPGTAGRAFADFVASLQPSWWIARALLAALLVTAAWAVDAIDPFVTAVLAVLAVPVSVWLGRLSGRDRRLLWVVVPLNGFAVAVVLIVGGAQVRPWSVVSDEPAAVAYGPSGLWQDGERQIFDVRPFDASGAPLSGIYLFDQDGNPIDVGTACAGSVYSGGGTSDDPGLYEYRPYPYDPRPYPRGTAESDPYTGQCQLVPPAPLVVAVPSTVPSTTPPPTASGQPPAPTAGPGGTVPSPEPTTAAPPVEPIPPTPTG